MGHAILERARMFGTQSCSRMPTARLTCSWFAEFDEVRRELAAFHSTMGRPSIDPELMIRMLIVGYCFGIRSERPTSVYGRTSSTKSARTRSGNRHCTDEFRGLGLMSDLWSVLRFALSDGEQLFRNKRFGLRGRLILVVRPAMEFEAKPGAASAS